MNSLILREDTHFAKVQALYARAQYTHPCQGTGQEAGRGILCTADRKGGWSHISVLQAHRLWRLQELHQQCCRDC